MSSNGAVSGVLLVILTILFPPIGVFMIAGCGTDLFINIILTICGFFPGHIHAFYLEFVYFDRRDRARTGTLTGRRAPFVFSPNVQNGGVTAGTVGY